MEDPLFEDIAAKTPEELAADAKKKQLVALIVGAMDGDRLTPESPNPSPNFNPNQVIHCDLKPENRTLTLTLALTLTLTR